MAVINADVEQIWQTIESLPPEGREVIRERFGFEKPLPSFSPISSGSPLDDAIFKISFEDYLALSDDERDAIHSSAYEKYRDWIDVELKRRGAEWMLVVGGDILEAGETLDEYPSRQKLYKSGYHFGLIPFVFVANPIVEESFWAALPKNDFYPTMSITVSSDVLQSSQNNAFSTPLVVYCVRNWRQSPFCVVNSIRKALVGRKLLMSFPIRVELNGQDRSTKIFTISQKKLV
jgi:hypothetical protein